jgi:NAD(P)-dependent dehydrogenase (short-subunit alcohol dehydrogenase family)
VAINDLPALNEQAREVVASCSNSSTAAVWLPGDLTSVAECRHVVAEAAAQLGGIDVLVNNAGGPLGHIQFNETTEEHFEKVLQVNLKTAFFLTQAAAPFLEASGRGRVVNMASELFFIGHPELVAYTVAKGGVVALTRSLALALAPSIRVNAVAPGPTLTERLMSERWFREAADIHLERVPLGRWGDPLDVARAVCFLASAEADWITGEVLNVNGGIVMP